jgi:hypothetical protein
MEAEDPRLIVGRAPTQQENLEQHRGLLTILADRLLAIGGERVVVPHDDPQVAGFLMELVVDHGRSFDAGEVHVEEGEPSDCHANVVRLWREGRGSICTGFALSPDGLWRGHSWLRTQAGTLVETTLVRDAYFGFEFDAEGAELYAATVA